MRVVSSSRLSSVPRLSHPRPIPAPISPLARALICPSVSLPSPSLCRSISFLSWLTQPPAAGLRSECVFNSALAENQNYRRISKQAAGAPLGTTVDNFHTAPSGKIVQVRNPF